MTFLSLGHTRPLRHDLRNLTAPLGLAENRLPLLVRGTIAILALSVFLFIVWAAITPIREIAKTQGQIIPSGYSQIVQHIDGGLVREILVHDGDLVQQGQTLLRIEGIGTDQNVKEQEGLLVRAQLQAERLRALIDGRVPNFSSITTDTGLVSEQQHGYESARASNESELRVLDEQIAQRNNTLDRLKASLSTARANQQIAQQALSMYSELYSKGLTNRTNYLRRQEEFNSRSGDTAELVQQMEIAKREIAEYKERRTNLADQQRSSAYDQLHATEAEITQRQQELSKEHERANRQDVRSPVMGYVKGLRFNTVGSVIPAGQVIMEIVPVNEQLIAEIRILPQEIGHMQVGQEAQIKVDSFDYIRFGLLTGKLLSISAMTFTDEATHMDYYKGRVSLDQNYVGTTPGRNLLIPGMTLDADIVTGEKTILGYLLRPLRTAMQNALTEH